MLNIAICLSLVVVFVSSLPYILIYTCFVTVLLLLLMHIKILKSSRQTNQLLFTICSTVSECVLCVAAIVDILPVCLHRNILILPAKLILICSHSIYFSLSFSLSLSLFIYLSIFSSASCFSMCILTIEQSDSWQSENLLVVVFSAFTQTHTTASRVQQLYIYVQYV